MTVYFPPDWAASKMAFSAAGPWPWPRDKNVTEVGWSAGSLGVKALMAARGSDPGERIMMRGLCLSESLKDRPRSKDGMVTKVWPAIKTTIRGHTVKVTSVWRPPRTHPCFRWWTHEWQKSICLVVNTRPQSAFPGCWKEKYVMMMCRINISWWEQKNKCKSS